MKRDMNLIRLLLLETEGEEPKPDLANYTTEQQVYHLTLLIESDLIDGVVVKNHQGYPAAAKALRLTWAGHEFLDAARNETVWHKAGEKIKKSGVDITLSLMKELLNQILKQHLGMP